MWIRHTAKPRRGAGMIEYALLVGLIAVGAIFTVQNSGERVSHLINLVASEVGTVQINVTNPDNANTPKAPELDPATCENPGSPCNDGTIYAGEYGNHKLYTTVSDASGDYAWNNGTHFGEPYDSSNWPRLGTTSSSDGPGNTAAILSANDKGVPYEAAEACAALNEQSKHGHSDWYLPAYDELLILFNNEFAIGGFERRYYWSSTEGVDWPSNAYAHAFDGGTGNGGNEGLQTKSTDRKVRCVRRL